MLAASFAAAAECVALLLSQGADINLKNKVGMTGRQEAKGAEVMDVYKNLDSGGIERLCKDFASVKQLIADLGGITIFVAMLTFKTAVKL